MASKIKSQLAVIEKALKKGLISYDDADQLLEELQFNQRLSDILQWGKYYFPDKFNLPFCYELHDYLVSIHESSYTSTLAPRGYAKTAIMCFLIPIYNALNFPDKYQHFLNIQATSTKAVTVNIAIRDELETNELIIHDYGVMQSEKWTEKQFVLTNGVIFTAIGAGDSVRGIQYRNKRPDYVIIDDLYDDDDAANIERIRKKNRWIWSSIYKAMAKDADNKKTAMHILGTAMHRTDILHQLKTRDGWKWRKFQGVKNWDKKTVLWPEVETFEKLMRDKYNMGTVAFNREIQNDCTSDEEAKVKSAWIKLYNGTIPEEEEVEWIRCGVDPAVGDKRENDYTAKAWVIKTSLGNYYVAGATNDKFNFKKNMEHIKTLHKIYEFDAVFIESIGAFQYFADELVRTTDLPIRKVTHVKEKLARLEAQSVKFENGKVFISEDIDEEIRETLIDQITTNNPPHDDIRDAVLLCLEDRRGTLGIASF